MDGSPVSASSSRYQDGFVTVRRRAEAAPSFRLRRSDSAAEAPRGYKKMRRGLFRRRSAFLQLFSAAMTLSTMARSPARNATLRVVRAREDLDFATRCASGDHAALRELFQREKQHVHRTLFRLLGSNAHID